MTAPIRFRLAALCGFAAVALGAFGAHGMKTILAQHGTTAAWETAVLYHLAHAVVLLVISGREPGSPRAWALFAAGIFIFSGTLYLLAATNIRWLGAITPLGGVCLLLGWLALAWPARSTDHSIQIPR